MKTKLLTLLGTTATLFFISNLATPSQAIPTFTSSEQSLILAQKKESKLNLTAEQQTQMRQIWDSSRTQIENVLTEEQRNLWKTAKDQGQNRRQIWSSLNLTSDQQAQIQRIREESKQKMKALLTPEQQQQLEQMQQNRQNRRQS